MTSLNWVTIRYRTKRGAKQKVKVADVGNNVELTIKGLKQGNCHSFVIDGGVA